MRRSQNSVLKSVKLNLKGFSCVLSDERPPLVLVQRDYRDLKKSRQVKVYRAKNRERSDALHLVTSGGEQNKTLETMAEDELLKKVIRHTELLKKASMIDKNLTEEEADLRMKKWISDHIKVSPKISLEDLEEGQLLRVLSLCCQYVKIL